MSPPLSGEDPGRPHGQKIAKQNWKSVSSGAQQNRVCREVSGEISREVSASLREVSGEVSGEISWDVSGEAVGGQPQKSKKAFNNV